MVELLEYDQEDEFQ